MKPPTIIDGVHVLAYAEVTESVRFTGNLELYVGGVLLGEVPRLAICESLDQGELLLFHCDDVWNVLGVQAWKTAEGSSVGTVEDVKLRAEKHYAGISSRWIDHHTSIEDARAYLAQTVGDERCSFCSRTMYEVQFLVEGEKGARICDLCVSDYQRELLCSES
jgi:hypothetical protein